MYPSRKEDDVQPSVQSDSDESKSEDTKKGVARTTRRTKNRDIERKGRLSFWRLDRKNSHKTVVPRNKITADEDAKMRYAGDNVMKSTKTKA